MPTPQQVAIDATAQTVTIRWTDGASSVLTLDALRRACPCASCKRRREQEGEGALPSRTWSDVQAEAVGSYGLRFDWDDGHNDGIYTWKHLRALARDG
ncbi:MAG: DUF971 domain-containing protein [Bacteroidetes bacterium]|jgi:DUF971 family protein|nr:DUF971 domain-containing protein [Bacteroidota bacterium]